jgi:hypothetical protein
MIYDEYNVTDIRSFNLMRYCEMINTPGARLKKAARINTTVYNVRLEMDKATSCVANSVYSTVSSQLYDIVHRDVIDSAYEEIYWMLSIEFSEVHGEWDRV